MARLSAQSRFAGSSEQSTQAPVVISYGLMSTRLQTNPDQGSTVKDVMSELAGSWSIPSDVVATVNGNTVDNNYVLKPGDSLQFERISGAKGS